MTSFFDNKARAAAAKAAAANGASSSTAKTPAQDENTRLQPWVEKYRPKTLSDVASQQHTTHILTRTLSAPNLPHMLFYGPPGTGKTSTILALSKQLFGPELYRSRVLELNASDERGISIVRTKIKDFARQQLSSAPAGPAGDTYKKLYPCPPFKIIVLDEADSMTQDAQSALRRTMETYSRITRFCLVCNYVTRIIDPLASRCSKFRFKSLDSADATKRLEDIAAAENVALDEGATAALVRCADGDLRKAITFLQSAARLVGALGGNGNDSSKTARSRKRKTLPEDDSDDGDAMEVDGPPTSTHAVTPRIVEEIAGVIPEPVITRLSSALRPNANKISQGTTYSTVSAAVTDLVADGWSAGQFTSQLYQDIVFDEGVADAKKNKILGVFSEVDKRLVDGADEHLVILDLSLRVAGILSEG